MGVGVFLKQWAQWLTLNMDSNTAAYGSSLNMTSPKKNKKMNYRKVQVIISEVSQTHHKILLMWV